MFATVQMTPDGGLSVGQDLPDEIWALVLHTGPASAMSVAGHTVSAFHDSIDVNEWTKAGHGITFRIAELLGPVHGLVP